MMINFDKFWCGTDETLAQYFLALRSIAAMDPAMAASFISSANDPKPEARLPRLFSQAGGVGIITIAGALVNNDSPYNAYYGLTSYAEIREAVVHAANDPAVGAILLDITSGGGAVSGLADTADLIKQIDKGVKPVHTYAGDIMGSAALWLGVSARSVKVGKTAEVGSAGVMMVHKEMSKYMAEQGIGVTVLRAGKFKALGNPFEPLGELAEGVYQAQLDSMYGMFMEHLSSSLNVSKEIADTKMGQGRVFLGQAAVDVGLASAVTTFDAVVSKMQVAIDSKKNASQYGANQPKGPVVKTAMTEQQIALLAESGAGAALKTEAEVALEASAALALAEAQKVADAKKAPEPDLVTYLKGELAIFQASTVTLTTELRDHRAASAAMAASHSALREIAVSSVDRLKVALGGTVGGTAALSDTELLASHAGLRADFETKFKVGGVAAVSSGAADEKVSATPDAVRQARLASTRPTAK